MNNSNVPIQKLGFPKPSAKVDKSHLNLRQYWIIFRRHWFLASFIFFSCFFASVLYTASKTKTYLATAKITVTPPGTQKVGEIEVGSEDRTARKEYIFYNTQSEILQSRKIIRRVLDRLTNEECEEFFGDVADEVSDGKVLSFVFISRRRQTAILEVSALGEDPKLAAKIANYFVDAFIEDNNLQSESNQGVLLNWLQNELPKLRKNVVQAQEDLQKFSQENKEVFLFGQNENLLYNEVYINLVNQLQEVEVELKIWQQVYEQVQDARRVGSLEAVLSLDFFEESELLTDLRSKQFDLESELEEYSIEFTPEHYKIVFLKKRLDNLESRIQREVNAFLKRQERQYLRLKAKRENLDKIIEEQKNYNVGLRQKYLDYQQYLNQYEMQSKDYNSFLDKIKELNLTFNYQVNNIRKIDEAVPPARHYRPNKTINYALGVMLGIVFAILTLFVAEHWDHRVEHADEVREILSSSIFGQVPFIQKGEVSMPSKLVLERPNSDVSEAFRTICTSIFFSQDSEQKHFVVSSPMSGDGKTTLLCNLSAMMAQTGHDILLIDGDLRRPSLDKYLSLDPRPGLSEVLEDNADPEELIQRLDSNLNYLSAGKIPENSYKTIYQSNLQGILQQLSEKYRYILIDSSPIGLTSDAFLLSQGAKALILVMPLGKYRKQDVEQFSQRLHHMNAPLHGIILNDLQGKYGGDEHYYGYAYGYGKK